MIIKRESINNVGIFYFLLVSGGGNILSQTIVLIISTIFFLILNKIYLTKKIFNLIISILILLIIHYFLVLITNNQIPNVNDYVRLFFLICFPLSIIISCQDQFWKFLEQNIFLLVCISLFFFSIQLKNFPFLNSFMIYIEKLTGNSKNELYANSRFSYHSIIIYTMNVHQDVMTSFLKHRNCGFAFEPGYFSFFINLGLFLSNIINKEKKIKKNIIYIIALISTFSTTGMIAILFIFIIRMQNDSQRYKAVYIPIISIVIIAFLTLDYGKDKVENLYNKRESMEQIIEKSNNYNDIVTSMGRFTALEFFSTYTFHHSPLFGFNGIEPYENKNIGNPSGLSKVIYLFGFVGAIFIFIKLYKSIKLLFLNFNIKGFSFFYLFFIVYIFSFPMINLPFFWLVCFYSSMKFKQRNRIFKTKMPNKIGYPLIN